MLVMTYNIRSGCGIDGKRSLTRIADIIRSSQVKIACLQEVGRNWPKGRFIDQAKWLGERLNMAFVFQPNLVIGPAGFGNLILTAFPIREVRSHSLTSRGEPRGLLEVTTAAHQGNLTTFCTHWGLNSEERLIQAAETAAVIKNAVHPCVLCGDLNDRDSSPAVRELISSSGLRDLFHDIGKPGPTFPSDTPRTRIDYILGAPSIKGISVKVLETPASDHLPIIADIELSTAENKEI